jgi:type IV pilus assembly protein PilC
MDELLAANQKLMEEELEALMDGITAMLEPIVISVMGVIMAVLFIGMFLPIYGILNKLGGG